MKKKVSPKHPASSDLKIHFMGIGGSGISGAAILAHFQGFQVSGCDLQEKTAYLNEIKKLKIPFQMGHDKNHLKDIDVLAVSPATFFQNNQHPELKEGRDKKIAITWQNFLGKYLQKDKRVISISGTHGKSTTTALASILLERATLNPWAILGANVREWKNVNYRVGKGDLFVTESDEFYDNFLNYSPEIIILNNIEFDHPDYFESEEKVIESFEKHIRSLKGKKILIFNQDSKGIKKLFDNLGKNFLKTINLKGYTIENDSWINSKNSVKAEELKFNKNLTSFKIKDYIFKLKIPGKYNVSNALGIICLAQELGIKKQILGKTLFSFGGVDRRLELLGERKGVRVYDDYAHHPTAIKVTISALRQKYPKAKLWVIVEPHTFSRTKALLSLYKSSFNEADEVIIGPIFKSRDNETFGVTGQSIVEVVKGKSIQYIDNFAKICKKVCKEVKKGDVIVIMGAGLSYQLARDILRNI